MDNRLPGWFRQKPGDPEVIEDVKSLLAGLNLHTVCENALCPNAGECLSSNTATFLILGDICTRHCTFCAVKKGVPAPLDSNEPTSLLEAVRKLGLDYIVITSVTRDDLPDGGASRFAEIIALLKGRRKKAVIEVLVPDFLGSEEAVRTVVKSEPQVINHNVETVPRLYPGVRPEADFNRSVELLASVKNLDPSIITKSGLMLGLGETKAEVLELMGDLREAECDLLTIGQYLRPSPGHHPVDRFVPPDEFEKYSAAGREMGFSGIVSAPLVRSSFQAAALYEKALNKRR
ncbi:lipoyl synthase [Chloroflexota bacterium]